MRPITDAEIDAGISEKGGFKRTQLAAWGVPWPAPKGWRKQLLRNGVPASCAQSVKPQAVLDVDQPTVRLGPDAIEIFTDGACEPNPGAGGWGFVVFRGAEEIHAACGGDDATTNNRMEMVGALQALRWLDDRQPAVVWTDSEYLRNGCTKWRQSWKKKRWTRGPDKPLLNADLWRQLDDLLDRRLVEIRWTRGHVGTIGNERADELAGQGRRELLEVTR
ncbi:MAG: hypothetical protein CMP81_15385 [Fulvimarina sp.]|nr:hypothetical protein [Fulvimarina sp.]